MIMIIGDWGKQYTLVCEYGDQGDLLDHPDFDHDDDDDIAYQDTFAALSGAQRRRANHLDYDDDDDDPLDYDNAYQDTFVALPAAQRRRANHSTTSLSW